MPRFQVTYYREYEVETHTSSDAVGITDQTFTDDVREALSKGGSNKISYLFKFDVIKIKK